MNSDAESLEILNRELIEASATIDFLRDELWIRGQELWEAYDRLYEAVVMLAVCDTCNEASLSCLKDRFLLSEKGREVADALFERDTSNARALERMGVDFSSWGPPRTR